jgi:hypothetical protein
MKTSKLLTILLLIATINNFVTAQKIDRIEPPSWFTGMKKSDRLM